MKNFNYTARDKTGSTKRGSLKAADRNAAMQELSAQGMVPLSITEGAEQPGGAKFKPVYAIASGIAALILAAWLGMNYLVNPIPQKSKRIQPKEKVTQKEKITRNNTEPKDNIPKPVALTNTMPETTQNLLRVQTTNEPSTVELTKAQQQEELKAKVAKRPFKSGTEQLMSLVFNTQLGDNPIPVPKIGKSENIQEILNTDISLYDDDPEKVERAKRNVALAKQLLKEYVEKGGNVDDFIKYYREELFKIHLEWKDSQKEFITLLKSGDLTAADAYLKKQNKDFQEKGIKPLNVPPQYKVE
jgi:hypothetical protein